MYGVRFYGRFRVSGSGFRILGSRVMQHGLATYIILMPGTVPLERLVGFEGALTENPCTVSIGVHTHCGSIHTSCQQNNG